MSDGSGAKVETRTAQLAELGLMTSTLLHELRDPVFALRARLQLLQAGAQELPQAIAGLHQSLNDVEALLDFYGGLGRNQSLPLPVDVNAELRLAADVLAARARRHGAELSVRAESEVLLVRVRPVTVRQVMLNLANNALDAVRGVESPTVEIWGARDTVGGVVLVVDDNGPGWPTDPKARDELTDPWVTSKGAEGTGLGLYLTLRLLEEAGGSLVLSESDLGGARALARWPAAR